MPLLQEKDRKEVQKRLKEMKEPVKLVYFTQEMECQYCQQTHELLEELNSLSDNLSLEVYNFTLDKEKVKAYNIDKIPATVVEGKKDYGIRFYGIPFGYEFATLLDDIVQVSQNESGLSEETKDFLKNLDTELHFQVFVTPTCPYCPQAVILAHRMAMESDKIKADMVEASEFPHLSNKYNVMGVPRTIINEDHVIEGAAPEPTIIKKIKEFV
jgi:glutaredoxin-like protein